MRLGGDPRLSARYHRRARYRRCARSDIDPGDEFHGRIKERGAITVTVTGSPSALRQQLGLATGQVGTGDATLTAIDAMEHEIANTPLFGALAAATGIPFSR